MKILMISNLYPNERYPYYGTFVKNFYEYINIEYKGSINIDIEKVVFDKKRGKLQKIINYSHFYLTAFYKLNFEEWDVVYIHYISHSSIPVLLSKKKYKIIANIHGSDYLAKSIFQKIINCFGKKLLKKADLIIVPSKYYLDIIQKDFPKKEVFESASGGINRELFYKNTNKKVMNNVINIGYVGRIDEGKGWHTLLEAIKNLQNDRIRLTIVGSGKEEHRLKQMIIDYKLSDKVLLVPGKSQKELNEYYNKFHVFIFPSESESLGLVGLEAMACGVPVIGSNISGIKTYLVNEYNGFLFETKNSLSLTQSIEKFLTLSVEEREIMIQNAINTSLKYDSKKVNLELLERIFKVVE